MKWFVILVLGLEMVDKTSRQAWNTSKRIASPLVKQLKILRIIKQPSFFL